MNENSLYHFFKTRLTNVGRRRWGCLDESQIAAYADHQITGRGKERAEAHLADCDYCLEQVGFLIRTKHAGNPLPVPDALQMRARKLAGARTRAEGSTVWMWGKFAAATAVACLVVATAISLRQSKSPTSPTVAPRQNPVTQPVQPPSPVAPTVPVERHPAVRGGQKSLFVPTLVSPAAGSAIQTNEIEFRWQPVPGALDYEVIALTLEGDEMWRQRTIEPSVRITRDANLLAGHKYYVIVRASMAEGKSVQSAPVAFTVGHR